MDEAGKAHTFGNGHQTTPHPRPFFYVQPATHQPPPYYGLYQQQPWQMTNPYGHYGMPGGFSYNRPCMPPYQYMQYPGYGYPPAPLYPMDYRRMFEPRFHTPAWNEMPRHHYQPQQQQPPYGNVRRETACSEVQTDPSDAITKLIECLDKIRASEMQGADRERDLDSGAASQSSGMFSPIEANRCEEHSRVLPSAPELSHLESPTVIFSDSTAAVYDGETSQRSLDVLSTRDIWSGALEEELPLDSSSVHEDDPEIEQSSSEAAAAINKHFLALDIERAEVADIQSDVPSIDQSVPKKCEAAAEESLVKQMVEPILPSKLSREQAFKDAAVIDNSSSKAELPEQSDHQSHHFKILKLPFESVLSTGDAAAGRMSSPNAPYYYNYLSMHTTHERMSVLSPSLDELSSRDEMFSTDIDDAELFPKHVYAGRKLAGNVGGSQQASEEVEDIWLAGSNKFMCACCGKSLAKGTPRSKGQGSKIYREEAGDSDEEGRYGRACEQPVRVVVRKHTAPRKTHTVPTRHAPKPWYKRGQYTEPLELGESGGVCKKDNTDGDMAGMTGSETQCRTSEDRLCRDDLSVSDQGRWGEADVMPRRRPPTPLPQRQELATRKVMYHRPRDEDNNDNEPPPLHWERGSTTREPRC